MALLLLCRARQGAVLLLRAMRCGAAAQLEMFMLLLTTTQGQPSATSSVVSGGLFADASTTAAAAAMPRLSRCSQAVNRLGYSLKRYRSFKDTSPHALPAGLQLRPSSKAVLGLWPQILTKVTL
jgi:hypothetical protein